MSSARVAVDGDNVSTTAEVAAPTPALSQELGRAQGTDFFAMDDLLTDEERSIRDRVRAFSDERLIPVANDHWERAEFPRALVPGYAELGVAGGTIQGLAGASDLLALLRSLDGRTPLSTGRSDTDRFRDPNQNL